MMGNDEDGRDVMQDGFIDAFTKIENLRDEVTFGAWLKRIMINHCINALKKKRLEVFNFDEKFDIPDKSDDSLNDDFTQTEIKRIMKAIDQISDGCKTVLNLYLFEGYDHKEIGQILAISESASKSQYSKARVKIRKVLEKTT